MNRIPCLPAAAGAFMAAWVLPGAALAKQAIAATGAATAVREYADTLVLAGALRLRACLRPTPTVSRPESRRIIRSRNCPRQLSR
jgi:hypothetical protein